MVSVCMYVFLQRQLSLRCETWYQIHFAVSACLSLRPCLSFFLYLCWSLPFLCHCLASHIWIKAESLGAAPHSFIHPLISVLWVRPCFRLDFCLPDVSRSPDLLFVLLFSCSRVLFVSWAPRDCSCYAYVCFSLKGCLLFVYLFWACAKCMFMNLYTWGVCLN